MKRQINREKRITEATNNLTKIQAIKTTQNINKALIRFSARVKVVLALSSLRLKIHEEKHFGQWS